MQSRRPHPARAALALVAATIVLTTHTDVLFVAALPNFWLSIAAALAVAVTTAMTYEAIREGPRSIVALRHRVAP